MKATRLILVAIDSISLALSFCFSLYIRQSGPIVRHFGAITYDTRTYLISFIVGAILLLIVFSAFRLYQVRTIEISARIFTVLKGFVIWTLALALIVYIAKFDFSRTVLFMTVILTAILVCLARYAYFRYRLNKKRDDHSGDSSDGDVHIIGTGGRAADIEQQIKSHLPNLSVIRHDYADSRALKSLAALKKADIFIADESMSREQVMAILAHEHLKHHSFRVVLDTFRLTTGQVRPNDLDEIPSISASTRPHVVYLICKRLADIAIAGSGILITSPLWLALAACIKIDSKGPVLIQQSRVGTYSQPFTLLKFRTMRSNATLYELAPRAESDPRITRVGRFLRRFSLDELPQLWNILRGDMSLVGPRPEMEFIVRKYQPWQRLRLTTKPGLTGLWQILGRKDIPLHENLEYDFYYVCNQNIFLDATIILKTIPAVLFGRGAY